MFFCFLSILDFKIFSHQKNEIFGRRVKNMTSFLAQKIRKLHFISFIWLLVQICIYIILCSYSELFETILCNFMHLRMISERFLEDFEVFWGIFLNFLSKLNQVWKQNRTGMSLNNFKHVYTTRCCDRQKRYERFFFSVYCVVLISLYPYSGSISLKKKEKKRRIPKNQYWKVSK